MKKRIALNLLVVNCKRTIPKVLLAMMGMVIVYYADIWSDLVAILRADISNSVYYFYNWICSYGVFSKLSLMLCAIPYATNFSQEWNSRYTFYALARCRQKAYGWSQILTTALSGGLSISLATLLLVSTLALKFPLYDVLPNDLPGSGYTALLSFGHTLWFYSSAIYLAFLNGAFWATVGLTVSAYLCNYYIALTSPFILYYVYTQANGFLHLPNEFRLDRLFSTRYPLSYEIALPIATIVAIILVIILGNIFNKKLHRSVIT